ncbi:expressed protein [Phakopsora pachyrhizi]|uniref:Expressed protein n=1 Tax=Phakopsora pachyrhizi TaxID=170000 RepID=A0AAV0ADK0_PHAPC|nr:expressed protein [Phakopsora pachyrhizi]
MIGLYSIRQNLKPNFSIFKKERRAEIAITYEKSTSSINSENKFDEKFYDKNNIKDFYRTDDSSFGINKESQVKYENYSLVIVKGLNFALTITLIIITIVNLFSLSNDFLPRVRNTNDLVFINFNASDLVGASIAYALVVIFTLISTIFGITFSLLKRESKLLSCSYIFPGITSLLFIVAVIVLTVIYYTGAVIETITTVGGQQASITIKTEQVDIRLTKYAEIGLLTKIVHLSWMLSVSIIFRFSHLKLL